MVVFLCGGGFFGGFIVFFFDCQVCVVQKKIHIESQGDV